MQKMKKDTSYTLKRVQRLPVILIGEGLLVGAVAGLIVLLYRVALTYAGQWLNGILHFVQGHPARIAAWFLVLVFLAVIVGKLVKWEPIISGSGIPQVEGEIMGKLSQNWKRVLPAKFAGGFLCLLGGLSLGREGPSIQLGAMSGQGISRLLDRGKTEERYLVTCGASAGLAAAFHAPLAGMMFAFEEIHKGFSVSLMVSVTAYITATLMGSSPIYESLLEKILAGKGGHNGGTSPAGAQKVLSEFVIMGGSVLEGRTVMEITWPKNCLLVALKRDGREMIPRGKTRLQAGDTLTVMTDERDAGYIHDKMENLCYTSF